MKSKKTKIKLEHYIAAQSSWSRRRLLSMLEAKRIKVNNKLVDNLLEPIDPNNDIVLVGDNVIQNRYGFLYYKLNKPLNLICTMDDPKGRRDLRSALTGLPPVMFPVGRLDRQTSGLLLITNDGQFSHSVMHPKFKILKEYKVTLDKPASRGAIARLGAGIMLEDGPVVFSEVSIIGPRTLSVKIEEGRNRIVRRTFEFLGYEVKQLSRTAIGPVTLGRLQPGEYRPLSVRERTALLRTDSES